MLDYIISRVASSAFNLGTIFLLSWLTSTDFYKVAIIYLLVWIVSYDGREIQRLMKR
jgi:hypothetical protein